MLFPIWHHLPSGNIKIYRLQTDSGETLLGRKIEPDEIADLTERLGLKQIERNALQIYASVRLGRCLEITPGYSLKQTQIYGESAIEIRIARPERNQIEQLKSLGCYTHIYGGKLRVFIPTDENKATAIIKQLREICN